MYICISIYIYILYIYIIYIYIYILYIYGDPYVLAVKSSMHVSLYVCTYIYVYIYIYIGPRPSSGPQEHPSTPEVELKGGLDAFVDDFLRVLQR